MSNNNVNTPELEDSNNDDMLEENVNLNEYSSSDDESCWQHVPVNSRKRANLKSPKLFMPKRPNLEDGPSTSNRFATLAFDKEERSNDINSSQQSTPKPPPIFVPNVDDIGKMVNKLSKVIPVTEFNYKSLRDGQVRLSIKTIDSFRKLIKYLDSSGIKYHTFQIKQERAFSVVIKGLHHSTSIEDIKAKLLLLGHQVRSVRNIISRSTKQPLPMFFVDLDPKSNNNEIYNMRSFDHAIIHVEAPKKYNDIVQCFRCQQFGHTKSYCRKPFRCVKCGLEHSTAECTKSPNTPPQCVHCLRNHTANYKGCEVYKKLVSKRTRGSIQNQSVQENFKNSINNNVPITSNNNALTYAQVARGAEVGVNNILQKIEDMLAKQIELTNTLMNMMSMLMTKLCN